MKCLLLLCFLAQLIAGLDNSKEVRYIVEYGNINSLSKRSIGDGEFDLQDPHDGFHSVMKRKLNFDSIAHYNYSSRLFHGASFSINLDDHPSALDNNRLTKKSIIKQIKSLPEVKNVWIAQHFTILENELPILSDYSPTVSPHLLTGVNELHSRGLTGKNVTVGIIDTGVDYLHPALGGGIGENFKVTGGVNYFGSPSNNITSLKKPDYNPYDCQGHGTHIAGIIAGNDTKVLGVAPGASIRSYKVFGCSGGTTEDVLIAAFQNAYIDGVNIITASVGLAGQGFLRSPVSVVASRMVEAGVFVSIAAGNTGVEGPRYPSSPGASQLVTTVGSAESDLIVTWTANAVSSSGENYTLHYSTSAGVTPNATGSYTVNFITSDLANCSQAATLGSVDANSQTALLLPASSKCQQRELFTSVKDLGYKAVLSYITDKTGSLNYTFPDASVEGQPIDVFGLADLGFGEWASNQTLAGHNLTLTFNSSNPLVYAYNNATVAAHVNAFSSWGPHYEDGLFYPAITAPGGHIFSTWLNGRYGILSGSSMATPYVSSILLTNKHPHTTSYAL